MTRFETLIHSQINNPTITTEFGHIGSSYTAVLCVEGGKIVKLGELIYRIWREGLATDDQLVQFGKECERFRVGERDTIPTLCYRESGELETH